MQNEVNRLSRPSVTLWLPAVVLVLAFTAIPAEFRSPRHAVSELLHLGWGVSDAVVNIVGYIPVGAALPLRLPHSVAGTAAVISTFAETTQLFTKGRSPSFIDVATNVIGAVIGWAIARRWKSAPRVQIDKRRAFLAGSVAVVYLVGGTRTSPSEIENATTAFLTTFGVPVNARGTTSQGRLEGAWTFNQDLNGKVSDASGQGVTAVLVHDPAFVAGVEGRALRLNGVDQYVDLGNPLVLRLAGSMTISAWINASEFPSDDAAIVSSHSGLGYQLDITVDQGPRTIGFKLANSSGQFIARYGRTTLEANRWYHVTGVYNADDRTLNVYLDGRLDNGCLLGPVTARQSISGVNVYIGRRSMPQGWEFAGSIDDVRIYSLALTREEIEAESRAPMLTSVLQPPTRRHESLGAGMPDTPCQQAEGSDPRIAGFIVSYGMVVAVAVVGLWPTGRSRSLSVFVSFVAGLLLVPFVSWSLPVYYNWIVPLLTLAGGASVAMSLHSETPQG